MSISKERRVRISKDKENMLEQLVGSNESEGRFSLLAEAITFAAALGYRKGKRVPFETSLEPIRQSVFANRGYDIAINLIALAETEDPKILSPSLEHEDNKLIIFEEYANGGLEYLRRELKGVVEIMNHLLLLIKEEEIKNDVGDIDIYINDLI